MVTFHCYRSRFSFLNRMQMNRPSRSDNRSRVAAEKELAERFLKADRRTRSTLLAVIPANLSNKVISITLVNDTKVTGTLKGIDGFSNIILGGSVRIDPPSYKTNALPLVGLKVNLVNFTQKCLLKFYK